MQVILNGHFDQDCRTLRFAGPHGIIRANSPDQVEAALFEMGSALQRGYHLAGYLAYELGYLLENKLASSLPPHCDIPLLCLGVFSAPIREAGISPLADSRPSAAYAGPLRHEWTAPEYAKRFDRVRALIAAGDVYQVNLTFRSRFSFVGDPLSLYLRLREKASAPYSAYVDDGGRQVLSLSPELFFSLSSSGEIVVRPMKGTASRQNDRASDQRARDSLRASEKERAENLMIVDLMRNDVGRIAQLGSIDVPELFGIETYPTLHQMVSTVRGRLTAERGPADLIRALFPCGSVTGAPKIRAMEVIRELERSARGVYCGAIGHFAPDGSAAFNVAIRTVTITGDTGELGIGSAVVHDSNAEDEYNECLLKLRYFTEAQSPLQLIETLRWCPESGFVRLDRHLRRLAASAIALGLPCDADAALRALAEAAHGAKPLRVRLTLSEAGEITVAAATLVDEDRAWRFTFSEGHSCSGDALLRHKTNWRDLYEREHARAIASGHDEVVFRNERGEITEGSRSNIFVQTSGGVFTPAHSCGLLRGCLRQEMLENSLCREAVLHAEDMITAEAIYFGNSLRGLVPAISCAPDQAQRGS